MTRAVGMPRRPWGEAAGGAGAFWRRVGRAVKEMGPCDSGGALLQAAGRVGSPARWFVGGVCRLRQYRPRSLATVLAEYQRVRGAAGPARPATAKPKKWFVAFEQEAYNLFCLLRLMAVPNQRVVAPAMEAMALPRRERLALARTGLLRYAQRNLAEAAQTRLQGTWEELRGRQVVLWMDNFYKRRYGVNPSRDDLKLDATALCALVTPVMGPPPAWPTLVELATGVVPAATRVQDSEACLLASLEELDAGVGLGDVRVPLDVVREPCRSLQWLPLSLEPLSVGSNLDFLQALLILQAVQQHTQRAAPVIVDENIHYRLLRLLYAQNHAAHDVVPLVRHLPFLYGVWHAYKFCVTHAYRTFFSLFTFLHRGELAAGETVASHPKLAFMERMVASVWLGGQRVLGEVRQEIVRLDWARQGRVVTRQQGAADLDAAAEGRTTADLRADNLRRRRILERQRERLDAKLVVLWVLEYVVTDVCPALFLMGHLVRQCNWEGRELGSGLGARRALEYALFLLLRLSEGRENTVKYIKTVSLALLLWRPWHTTLPGCYYSEEFGESMLAKLTALLRTRPTFTAHADVADLFHLVEPTRGTKARRGGLSQENIDDVVTRVRQLVATQGRCCVPRVAWSSGPKSAVRGTWEPATLWLPRTLRDGLPMGSYCTAMRRALQVMVQSRPTGAGVEAWLEAHAGRRTGPELAKRLGVYAALARHTFVEDGRL